MAKILIIDDEAPIRSSLREILEYENYQVSEAEDGAEGVKLGSKFAFDVWGDTINTAARLESYGSPDCIHMTKTTYELLNYKEKKVEEKSIEIRGKGLMDTVLVNVQ